jgi:predicted GIY-YIG superfamily endonuclease
MLADAGIISRVDAAANQAGLETVRGELQRSELPFRVELEDIHMHIETRLKELIGDAGGRLHTGRSRNDQVVTDFRLWTRSALAETSHLVTALQGALVRRAGEHRTGAVPGFASRYGCVLLVWFELAGSMEGAIGREKQIKAGSRARKLAPVERVIVAPSRSRVTSALAGAWTVRLANCGKWALSAMRRDRASTIQPKGSSPSAA